MPQPTPPPHTIRRATAADNVLLSELGAALFTDAFGADNTPENLAAYLAETYNPAKQASELADPATQYLILEVDGRPAGYARLTIEPPPAPHSVGQHPMELVRFYFVKQWHGTGLAAVLMQACLAAAHAAGCDALWLSTWQRNGRGIAFYEKHGFTRAGTLTFVVGDDPQTDWLLVRSVP
jgi:GNAT superfamily N-acetyltransferase